jgi:hypothetical protein
VAEGRVDSLCATSETSEEVAVLDVSVDVVAVSKGNSLIILCKPISCRFSEECAVIVEVQVRKGGGEFRYFHLGLLARDNYEHLG